MSEPASIGGRLAGAPQEDRRAEVALQQIDPELERQVQGLPGTFETLVAEPSWHQPQVVEALIDWSAALLAAGDGHARHVADAARVLATELPESLDLEEGYGLRALTLELWGTVQRLAGQLDEAEAALLIAFELQAQTEAAEASDLAVTLGRLALVASDGERPRDLATYAAEAVAITRAADRDGPLSAFSCLWRTVMADRKSLTSAVRLARALFWAISDASHDFRDSDWALSLEIIDHGDAGTEIRLERQGPQPGRSNQTSDDLWIVRYRERL